MHKLIVTSQVSTTRWLQWNYLLVNPKDFNLKWCQQCICGFLFESIEIWDCDDIEATAYAITRVERLTRERVLLAQNVMDRLIEYYIDIGWPEDDPNLRLVSDNISVVR